MSTKGIIWMTMIAFVLFGTHRAFADQLSLLQQASLLGARAPLFQMDTDRGSGGGASLFAGESRGTLFAPIVRRHVAAESGANLVLLGRGGTQVEQLRHLIARAEAGSAGYDAVQHGAKRRPAKKPTDMTIAEIYAWIKATPGQPHAIGRYQFIPATLKRLVRDAGLAGTTRFSPNVQDMLADQLLEEAGYLKFRQGKLTRKGFMNNLAKIWAGLPTSSGKSYYDGYAGNSATMTWGYYDREMARIFSG